MNIKELLAHIDSFAPFDFAEEWDNSGLMVGDYDADVKKIAVGLDAVTEIVKAVSENGCNVLVCHHPLIFRPVKRIDNTSEQGRVIIEAVKRDVNIIAAHTNWDKAQGGVNDVLARQLCLNNVMPLADFGNVGELNAPVTLNEFLERVKKSWDLSHIDLYAEKMPERIFRVALCGGSGAEFWRQAKKMNADIYLTADMKYHELIDAAREGLAIGLLDHGEMERASIPELARKISECGIETIVVNMKALLEPLRL